MNDAAAPAAPGPAPEGHRARQALLKRLADVLSLPASRINAFERSVVGDLLVEMLRLAEPKERLRVAARLAPLNELPNALSRLLLRDTPDIAGQLIERCAALTDADLVQIIAKTAKQRRDTIAEYQRVGREDLAANESAELAIIEQYLPKQLSPEELEAIVQQVIAETGAQSVREMNKVMPLAMERVAGQADGRAVNQIVRRLLG